LAFTPFETSENPLGTDRRPAHFPCNTPTRFWRTLAMDQRLPHCERRR
jgi:hypothetical protein